MPIVEVETSEDFDVQVEQWGKKYSRLPDILEGLIGQLEQGDHPGDKIPGVGYDAYKVRLPNPDAGRGKSGGFRVIYYVQLADRVVLLTIYPKSQRENIPTAEIRRIINRLKK